MPDQQETTAEAEASQPASEPADPPASSAPSPLPRHDFRQPQFLTAAELRRLRLRHEDFVRSLGARLSIYLRLEFGLSLVKLHTVSYRAFTGALANPTHISLFKVEPLRGIGLLEIPSALASSIVDRLLGGPAQALAGEHTFSEIELALIDQVLQLVLAEWCHLWAGESLRPVQLGHESNSQFLQTAAHDTVMLVLVMETKLGENVGQMQLALPCAALEAFIRKLAPAPERPAADTRLTTTALKWNVGFDSVVVPVTAMWNDLEVTARTLAHLKPGDVLTLAADGTKHVKLRLADQPKFEGHLGTANGKWAVAVTGVLPTVPSSSHHA